MTDSEKSRLGEIPKPGETLAAKYRIERAIAEGGMGVVMEAMHLQLEERVAIKFLRPEVLGTSTGTDATTRFLREARAAIKIRSEHVVRIYDVASLESGVPYIVMEYLEGQDLEQLLDKSGRLEPTDAVDYALQACEALSEAHPLGIVHRDLKPANLFLTKTASGVPSIKVLDFGISKIASVGETNMSMTTTQAVMGSPLYMSPEQMRATRDADARSDIWAIGVILYELLAGKPPFQGDTMTQVCAAILQDVPVRIASLRNDVSADLERVILRCLEKRPQDRFATVADLADALAPFASPLGQEAARRAARSASFATGRGSQVSEREVSSLAPRGAAQPSMSATATAWTDVDNKPKKSKAPLFAGIGALVLVAGIGSAFVLSKGDPKSDAKTDTSAAKSSPTEGVAPKPTTVETPPPAASTTVAAAPITPTPPPSADPTSTAEPASSATAKTAAAPTSNRPKKTTPVVNVGASAAAAPKPVAPTPSTPKASWNERK